MIAYQSILEHSIYKYMFVFTWPYGSRFDKQPCEHLRATYRETYVNRKALERDVFEGSSMLQ